MSEEILQGKFKARIQKQESGPQACLVINKKFDFDANKSKLLTMIFSDNTKEISEGFDSLSIFAGNKDKGILNLPTEFYLKMKNLFETNDYENWFQIKKSMIFFIQTALNSFPKLLDTLNEFELIQLIIHSLPFFNISGVFRIIKNINQDYFNSLATNELFSFLVHIFDEAKTNHSEQHMNHIFSFISYFFLTEVIPEEFASKFIHESIQSSFVETFFSSENKSFYIIQNCRSNLYLQLLLDNNFLNCCLKDFTILPIDDRKCLLKAMLNLAKSGVFTESLLENNIFYYFYAWSTGSFHDNQFFQLIFPFSLKITSYIIQNRSELAIPAFLESKYSENIPDWWNAIDFTKYYFECFNFIQNTLDAYQDLQEILDEIEVISLFEVIIDEADTDFLVKFLFFCKNVLERRSKTKKSSNLSSQIDEFFQDEYALSQLEDLDQDNEELTYLVQYFLEKYQSVE